MTFTEFLILYILIAVMYAYDYVMRFWDRALKDPDKKHYMELLNLSKTRKWFTIILLTLLVTIIFPAILISDLITLIKKVFTKERIKK